MIFSKPLSEEKIITPYQQKIIQKHTDKCNELGYTYIEHFKGTKSLKDKTYTKCICKDCEHINIFATSNLLINCVRCQKCKPTIKKTFKIGYIYKLMIGPYYYIGITSCTMKTRYNQHKKSCFNKRKNIYKSKLYSTIRDYIKHNESKSCKSLFEKYVIQKQVAIIDTSWDDMKRIESELINLNNEFCLNSIM